jgi:hypothetical protein
MHSNSTNQPVDTDEPDNPLEELWLEWVGTMPDPCVTERVRSEILARAANAATDPATADEWMTLVGRTIAGLRATLNDEPEPWLRFAKAGDRDAVQAFTWRQRYITCLHVNPDDPAPELNLLPHPQTDRELAALITVLRADGIDQDGWLTAAGISWEAADTVIRILLALRRFWEPFGDLRTELLREAWSAWGYDD